MTYRDPSPRPHLPAPVQFDGANIVQLALTAQAAEMIQGYLRGRDLYLFPVEDDLPTYGVGISDRLTGLAPQVVTPHVRR